jgi:hypothetical protein
MSTFNLPVSITVENATSVVFHDNLSVRVEPKGYHHSGSVTRTFSNVFNAFDAKRGYYIPKGAYAINIKALDQDVTNNVLELTDGRGTNYKIAVRLVAMGKHSVSVTISVTIIDEVSATIKSSTVDYRSDTAANLRRTRDIASGRQHASELRSANLPTRSGIGGIETVSLSQMIKDEYAYLG